MRGDGTTSTGRDPTQVDILLTIARRADLFHTADDTGYADVTANGHRETWPLRSAGFHHWLTQAFFASTEGAPTQEALQAALNLTEAQARFAAPQRTVHVRVAGVEERLYVDLADSEWRAIEIDASGWRVIKTPPVRFRRAAGMQPLPVPARGGHIDSLRPYFNVSTDADFVVAVAWMLAVLRDQGPYPLLALSGEQGSAKSTVSAMLRALLDPNAAPLRGLPREERDLFIEATHSHVLTFDNVSGMPPWLSDACCRLATGGGFARRRLYTDQDEVLFDAVRPILLNGIEHVVTRPDLADRTLVLTLDPIPEDRRRPAQDLWNDFRRDAPVLLGVLLDGLVEGLRQFPTIRLDRHPRMADFARWVTACESAFWPAGTFLKAYGRNRRDTVDEMIETDGVAATLRAWVMTQQTTWTGTATDLLTTLTAQASPGVLKSGRWPSTAHAFSSRLRRAATFLRSVGVHVEFERQGHQRTRTITVRLASATPLCRADGQLESASAPTTPHSLTADAADTADARRGGVSATALPPPTDAAPKDAATRPAIAAAGDGRARKDTDALAPRHAASTRNA